MCHRHIIILRKGLDADHNIRSQLRIHLKGFPDLGRCFALDGKLLNLMDPGGQLLYLLTYL